MKRVKYILTVKNISSKDSAAWDEEMEVDLKDDETIEQNGRSVVHFFNSTLRPNEEEREFMSTKLVSENIIKLPEVEVIQHLFSKLSLVTEKGGYDRMKCENCGCIGRRYGLGNQPIKLEKEFNTKKYLSGCPNTK